MDFVGIKDFAGNSYETDPIGEIKHCVCKNLPVYDSVGGWFIPPPYI